MSDLTFVSTEGSLKSPAKTSSSAMAIVFSFEFSSKKPPLSSFGSLGAVAFPIVALAIYEAAVVTLCDCVDSTVSALCSSFLRSEITSLGIFATGAGISAVGRRRVMTGLEASPIVGTLCVPNCGITAFEVTPVAEAGDWGTAGTEAIERPV